MKTLLFKKFSPAAVEPFRAHPTDAGFDLTAVRSRFLNEDRDVLVYETDLGVAIPEGHVGILKERSSVRKMDQILVGGVIDSGYTGPIEVSFQGYSKGKIYQAGDRVCQLVIVPIAPIFQVQEVGDLRESPRGQTGFGSSGQ